jgi:hypothetical protein
MKIMLASLLVLAAFGFALAGPQVDVSEELLGQYYVIQKSLASDSLSGVSTSASQIADLSRKASVKSPQAKTQFTALANAAAKLQTTDLKLARAGFGDLSDSLIALMKAAPVKSNPPYQYYCPMVKKNWLQDRKEIRNPYYGSSMLTCGELVQASQPKVQRMGPNHP